MGGYRITLWSFGGASVYRDYGSRASCLRFARAEARKRGEPVQILIYNCGYVVGNCRIAVDGTIS